MVEKSVAEKLGLKSGKTLLLLNAPHRDILGSVPDNAPIVEQGLGPFPLILTFAPNHQAMVVTLQQCKLCLAQSGVLWLAYPKKTSTLASDIDRDVIRAFAKTIGLETVAIIAIDSNWSALRLKRGA